MVSRHEIGFDYSTAQRWESITTNGGSVSTSQHHLPAASTTPTYDLDGNLTSDGQWIYTWDAENRLTSATRSPAATSAGAPFRLITYRYDSQSRQFSRSVVTTPGGTPTGTLYLHDGWNVIAEYAGTTLAKTYLWGLDLSGTPQGAGGVGGLLSISDIATATTHYPCYDGNSNVRKLLNATTLVTTATYDYGPFGELVRATGPYALSNSYRFSTKPQDADTRLYYYGYRYYDPLTGRWPSRDPIGERGGVNLYGMVRNRSINAWDYLGLSEDKTRCCDAETIAKGKAELEAKYRKAYDQFKAQGTQSGGVNAQSCKNISGAVLPALDPVPKCWTCKEEAGATNWSPFASDHQWVTCKSHPKDGGKGEEIAFDYWGGNKGSVSAGNIRNKYDNPQEVNAPGTVRHNTCDRTNPTGEEYRDGLDGVRDIPPTPNPMPQPNPQIIHPGY